MQKIRFVESDSEYNVYLEIQLHRIICTFCNDDDATNAPLLEGFFEINEHNGVIQSDFTKYKYIYKKESSTTFILTNDENDIYIESENPEFDLSDYVLTLEEVKDSKIMNLSSICNRNIINGIDIEIDGNIEHFSYKDEDQMNIKELFDIVCQTNVPVYYHANGSSCKEYSPEQIIAIYATASTNKNHHTTYYNQLKMYIKSLQTKEEVESVFYGQELVDEYLTTYIASMGQAQLVLETLLAKRASILSE